MGLTEWLARHRGRGRLAVTSTGEAYERAIQLYNAGDLEGLANTYTEDAILVTPDGTAQGRAAILEYWRLDKAANPDRTVTTDVTVEQGDIIATEWTWAATNTGLIVMPDGTKVPPTGNRVETKGMDLTQMRDGKAAAQRMYWDNMAVARQLGLLPESAST